MAIRFTQKSIEKLMAKNEVTADGVAFSSLDVVFGVVTPVFDEGGQIVEYRAKWKKSKRQQRLLATMAAGLPSVCGARCKDGHACRAKCAPGRKRCKWHGGLSTGPTSPEGRAAVAESNRRRAKPKKS